MTHTIGKHTTTRLGTNTMSTPTNDWAYCTLTVSAGNIKCKQTQHSLYSFIEEVKDLDDGSPLTLNSIYEIPNCLIDTFTSCDEETYKDNYTLCGFRNMFEFTYKEWGVPYDVVSPQIDEESVDKVVFSFKTRCNAPLQWIQNVSLVYGELVFDIEAINEMDLWDSYESTYVNGKQIFHYYHKNQNKK